LATVQGDVSKLEDLDRLFSTVRDQAGRLDILFANAGTAEHATIEHITERHYDTTFALNVKGVLFCMQKAIPLMPDGAAVILNASMWTIKGIPGFGVLSASKAAVRSFARTWANELRSRRIRVNVVSPGPVHTPAIENATAGRTRKNSWQSCRATSHSAVLPNRMRSQKSSRSSRPTTQAMSTAPNSSWTAAWFKYNSVHGFNPSGFCCCP
jgi:NAD(P)-dependent dehydrogenase (short-subunit alcohol dehydrogenase family)